MRKRPGLGNVVGTGNPDLDRFCQSTKQTLDAITGQAPNMKRLEPLRADATMAEVIERLNVIVERLQG